MYTTILNAENSAIYKYGTNPLCYYGKNGLSSNFSDCSEFSSLFLNELKIVKFCDANAIVNGCIPRYKGSDELGQSVSGCLNFTKEKLESYPAYILNNGTIIMPASNLSRITTNMIIDINGKKGPNKWGYDLFYFYTYFDGNKYSLENTGGGCMPLEKGGRKTDSMILHVLSH